MVIVNIYDLIIAFVIFVALFAVGKLIYNKVTKSQSKLLNPLEYLPEEEVQTLRQVFFLIMMLIFFMFILYIIVGNDNKELISISVLQIVVSLYVVLTLDYSSLKNRVLFFLLIPFEAITILFLDKSFLLWPIYLMHIFVYFYLMKVYFDKFRQFTELNGLGITILLLFSLIFISFIVTFIVEGVNPLNAIVMVSNAFTSNGYSILGKSEIGKLNSLFLVWGGYILSGAGTATLTVAILTKHNRKHEEELNRRLDELEELIRNNKE